MGSFLLQYGRKCYSTIQPEVTTWPIVFDYQIQSNEDILLHICSLSHFSHQFEDDKMSYELVEYLNKKNNSIQKFPIKMGSLSLTIIFGFPCIFWIVSINAVATILALNEWDNVQKCAYLVSLSITTVMTLFPSDLGKPMIKSIEITSQHWLGMDKGVEDSRCLLSQLYFAGKPNILPKNFEYQI